MSAIDISYWQHNPDFARVHAADVSLVIMKCGGGEGGRLYQDSVYAGNRAAARAQGLAIGSYFFNGPVDPIAAADFQFGIIDWRPGDLVAIDVESNGATPRWTPAQVLAWCQRILAHGVPAGRILVYMSSSVLGAGWGAVAGLGVGLWVAQYGPNDGNAHSVPGSGPWPSWALWQYTSAATCPGISGLVDTNQINPSWASQSSQIIESISSIPGDTMFIQVLDDGQYVKAGYIYANDIGGHWRGLTNLEGEGYVKPLAAAGKLNLASFHGTDVDLLFAVNGVWEQPTLAGDTKWSSGNPLIGFGALTGRLMYPGTPGPQGQWYNPQAVTSTVDVVALETALVAAITPHLTVGVDVAGIVAGVVAAVKPLIPHTFTGV